MITAEICVKAQFYDVDAMRVVWHGNYVRFFEQARCALLDKLGYNYDEMAASGYVWPIVDLRIRYVRPVRFNQEFTIAATLLEYENRLKIGYVARDVATGTVVTKGYTIQVAVDAKSNELCFETPAILHQKVRDRS